MNMNKQEKMDVPEKRRWHLPKKRGGQRLTQEEIQEIKEGRKKLRKQMREQGIKSRKEFELTASGLGLYFDKPGFGFLWFLSGRGLWVLLGLSGLLVLVLGLLSLITQMRGLFTINMSQRMFREGYALSEEVDFIKSAGNLFCEPAVDVPCISITQIPEDIYDNTKWENPGKDGAYQAYRETGCFYYTFYIRNEGESTTGYRWDMRIESIDKQLADAMWVMIFEDEEMTFYAKANELGKPETLPAMEDDTRGYRTRPLMEKAKYPDEQYGIVKETNNGTFYRVIPKTFLSSDLIATGEKRNVQPKEIHKYTVVVWIEGDDPQCNDDLIGGHVGLGMHFRLIDEEDVDKTPQWWEGLQFWKD